MVGFASGFFGTLVNDIKDREEYIRTQTEKKRDYLMGEGLKRRTQVQAMREQLSASAAGLKALGIDEGIISSAILQDPNEVIRLNETLQSKRAEIDAGKLDPGAFLKGVNEYKPSDVPLSEAVQKALPDFVALTANERDPAKKQKSLFEVMFNLNPLDQIEENVYGSELIDGYTGGDVMAALGAPVAMKGSGGSNVEFNYGSLVPEDRVSEEKQKAFATVMAKTLVGSAQAKYAELLNANIQPEKRQEIEKAIKEEDYQYLARLSPEVLQSQESKFLQDNIFLSAYLGMDPMEFLKSLTEGGGTETPKADFDSPEAAEAYLQENPNATEITYLDADGVPQLWKPKEAAETLTEEKPKVPDEALEAAGIPPVSTDPAVPGLTKTIETISRDTKLNQEIFNTAKDIRDGKFGRPSGISDTSVGEYFLGQKADKKTAEALSEASSFLQTNRKDIREYLLENPEKLELMKKDPVSFVEEFKKAQE